MDNEDFNYIKMFYNLEIDGFFDTTSGSYFPGIAKIKINTLDDDLQNLIIFIHEYVHKMLGEASFGFILADFNSLIDFLFVYYTKKSSELIETYLSEQGYVMSEDQLRVMEKYRHQILEFSSKDENFVSFLKFVYGLIEKNSCLNRNHVILNEGIATFISLNIDKTSSLNKEFIGVDFEKIEDIDHFKALQEQQKRYIMGLEDENPYKKGYLYAEKLYNKFGEDNLFRTGFWASSVPYHNYDLVGASEEEFKKYSSGIYNPDSKWLKMLEYDANYIDQLSKTPELLNEFPLEINGVSEFPELDRIYAFPGEVFYYRVLLHPLVIEQLERITGKKQDFDSLNTAKVIEQIHNFASSGINISSLNNNSLMTAIALESESFEDFKNKYNSFNSKDFIDALQNESGKTKSFESNNEADLNSVKALFVDKLDLINISLRKRFIKRIEMILELSKKLEE